MPQSYISIYLFILFYLFIIYFILFYFICLLVLFIYFFFFFLFIYLTALVWCTPVFSRVNGLVTGEQFSYGWTVLS